MVVAAWGPCDVVISQLPSAPRNLRPSGTDPGRPRTPPETTQTGRYETRGSSVVNWNEQQTGTKMPDFPAPVLVLDATAAKAEQTRQEASAQPTTTVVASPTPHGRPGRRGGRGLVAPVGCQPAPPSWAQVPWSPYDARRLPTERER